jgi:hypothetical protein
MHPDDRNQVDGKEEGYHDCSLAVLGFEWIRTSFSNELGGTDTESIQAIWAGDKNRGVRSRV